MRPKRSLRSLVACSLVLALLAPAASADHLQGYENNPVDHDELGRSSEPDGERTPPGMFVFQVTQAVIDRNRDRYADVPTASAFLGHDPFIAPGCTDAAGNRLSSGQCGLYTVLDAPPVNGVVVDEGNCPGRYAGEPMMFLDSRADFALHTGGSPTTGSPVGHPIAVPLNYKIRDVDRLTGGVLSGLGVNPVLSGTMMLWAWYGLWEDKNCNGVIDNLPNPNGPVTDGDNEFVWLGACKTEGGGFSQRAVNGGVCIQDYNPNSNPVGEHRNARTTMTMWIWPGTHDVAPLPSLTPGINPDEVLDSVLDGIGSEDIPPLPGIPPSTSDIPPLPQIPRLDSDFENSRPDAFGLDATGAEVTEDRLWMFGGLDGVGWFYDHSIFLDTWIVTGVNCRPEPSSESEFTVGVSGGPGSPCTFVDVDRYPAISPTLGNLLGSLKSSVYNLYNVVADIVNGFSGNPGPVQRFIDQTLGKSVYDAALGGVQGMVRQLFVDQGWSREPNVGPTLIPALGEVVEDRYLETRHGTCDRNPGTPNKEEAHRGWCNYNVGDPTGNRAYDSYRQGVGRGWMDLKAKKLIVAGAPGLTDWPDLVGWDPLFPGGHFLDSSDHRRTLDPGEWAFEGMMGRWADRDYLLDETVFPNTPPELPCSEIPEHPSCVRYPKDGWIGFVSSGQQEYQGYGPTECNTERGPGLHPWSVCNPYKDGNIAEPQDYGEENPEWEPDCNVLEDELMWVYPADGEWSIPILGAPGGAVLPGSTTPIALAMGECTGAQVLRTKDTIILPLGSMGEDIITVFTASVLIPTETGFTLDEITDVDIYASAVVEPLE